MAFQDKKFLDAEGITHLVKLLDEYPNNQVLGSVIDAIEGELEQKADKSEIPEVPVQDVQINRTSILNNGIANVPLAGVNKFGVISTNGVYGLAIDNGILMTTPAPENVIKPIYNNASEVMQQRMTYRPITARFLNEAVFYGLAKAAGDTTQSRSDNAVGTYTDSAKAAIQTMLDVPSNAAMTTAIGNAIGNINSFDMAVVQALPTEDISTHTIYLIPKTGETNDVYDEYVYINDAWEMVGNTQIDLSNYVQKTDYATREHAGIVTVNTANGLNIQTGTNGELVIFAATETGIKFGTSAYQPIVPSRQHTSTFYGLAKAAGDTTQSSSNNAVGTYTPEAKAAIQTMLDVPSKANLENLISIGTTAPTMNDSKIWIDTDDTSTVQVPTVAEMEAGLAAKVSDVQVNGVSVVSSNVANIPMATSSTLGVVKEHTPYGVGMESGTARLYIVPAISSEIKGSAGRFKPIVPEKQPESVFYGLAKAAGADEKDSQLAFGTYSTTAKSAIQTMLGITDALAEKLDATEAGLKVVRLI